MQRQLLWEVVLVEQMQVGNATLELKWLNAAQKVKKIAAGVLKFIQLVTWLSLE